MNQTAALNRLLVALAAEQKIIPVKPHADLIVVLHARLQDQARQRVLHVPLDHALGGRAPQAESSIASGLALSAFVAPSRGPLWRQPNERERCFCDSDLLPLNRKSLPSSLTATNRLVFCDGWTVVAGQSVLRCGINTRVENKSGIPPCDIG